MPSQHEGLRNRTGQPTASVGQIIHSAANINSGMTRQLVPRLLEAVRANLGMDVGFISRFAEGRREFLHVSSDGRQAVPTPTPGDSDPVEESACIRVVKTGT